MDNLEQSSDMNTTQAKSRAMLILERIENFIVFIIFLVIVILVIAQVYSRYIMGNSLTWTGEFSRFLAIWLIFLGSAIALRRNLHIQVDNLYNVVSDNVGKILYLVRNIIILAFFVMLFIGSLSMLEIVQIQTSPSLGLKMDIVYVILPISLFLMTVILLIQSFTRFRKKRG